MEDRGEILTYIKNYLVKILGVSADSVQISSPVVCS